jgi:type IV secretory pathway VirB3-like protein
MVVMVMVMVIVMMVMVVIMVIMMVVVIVSMIIEDQDRRCTRSSSRRGRNTCPAPCM